MIGKAMIVLWSFTLPPIGPTSSVIDIGVLPTNETYAITNIILRGADIKQFQHLKFDVGTNSQNPNNIVSQDIYVSSELQQPDFSGTFNLQIGTFSLAPPAQDIYVQVTMPQEYTGAPIQVDILGYPTN